jgi:hypothetical protein
MAPLAQGQMVAHRNVAHRNVAHRNVAHRNVAHHNVAHRAVDRQSARFPCTALGSCNGMKQ